MEVMPNLAVIDMCIIVPLQNYFNLHCDYIGDGLVMYIYAYSKVIQTKFSC